MVPASLYLGFTASIIWVGQVIILLSNKVFSTHLCLVNVHTRSQCRAHILLLLPSVMQETTICPTVQLQEALMENSGVCSLAHRYKLFTIKTCIELLQQLFIPQSVVSITFCTQAHTLCSYKGTMVSDITTSITFELCRSLGI